MAENPTPPPKHFFSRYDLGAALGVIAIIIIIFLAIFSIDTSEKRLELVPAATLGLVTLIALYVQLRINYRQWEEMQTALERSDLAMERGDIHFEMTNRPVLTVARAEVETFGQTVTVIIKNSGLTQANNVYTDVGYYVLSPSESVPDPRKESELSRVYLGILGAGTDTHFTLSLSGSDPEDRRPEDVLCLYGIVFGTSLLERTFRTEFCLTVKRVGLGLEPAAMSFYPFYNQIGQLISMSATARIELSGTATPTILKQSGE